MLNSARQELIKDPSVALDEEIAEIQEVKDKIKQVEADIKRVNEKLNGFEAKHLGADLSQNAEYLGDVSYRNGLLTRLTGLEARLTEAQRGRRDAQTSAAAAASEGM